MADQPVEVRGSGPAAGRSGGAEGPGRGAGGSGAAGGCPGLLKVSVRQSDDGRKKKIKITNPFIKITIRVKDPSCIVTCEDEEPSGGSRQVGFVADGAGRGSETTSRLSGLGFHRRFTLGFLPPPEREG